MRNNTGILLADCSGVCTMGYNETHHRPMIKLRFQCCSPYRQTNYFSPLPCATSSGIGPCVSLTGNCPVDEHVQSKPRVPFRSSLLNASCTPPLQLLVVQYGTEAFLAVLTVDNVIDHVQNTLFHFQQNNHPCPQRLWSNSVWLLSGDKSSSPLLLKYTLDNAIDHV